MKVFVSGIAGFLGSHIAESFLKSGGHEVVGIDNMLGGYRDNVPQNAEFHVGDCNDHAFVARHMQGVDVVYHCAATAYEGLSVFSPHLIAHNIVTATTGMLVAAVNCGVRRFIACSSMARYGENLVPFTEAMTPRPQDPYGISKLSAEMLIKNVADTHGMEWVIAVPHNIIGPRQKYDDPYRNVAAIWINLMLQGKQPYIYGDGTQSRCFSFVSDVVNPLRQMASLEKVNQQIINIGPDKTSVTVGELAETIARLLNFDLRPIFVPGRPQEVKLANCSADKARRLLGYEAKVSLEDGLRSMIDYIRSRGSRPFKYHLPIEIENDRTPKTWTKRLF